MMKLSFLLALGALACASNVRADSIEELEALRLKHDAEMVKDMERLNQEIRADHAAYNEHLMKWVTDNQDKFAAERLAKAKAAQAELEARQVAIDKALDRALSASAIRANDAYTNYMTH
jgi:DNA repair exonuclease SbcCD ATPase subunit